jgi:hypothetical protein
LPDAQEKPKENKDSVATAGKDLPVAPPTTLSGAAAAQAVLKTETTTPQKAGRSAGLFSPETKHGAGPQICGPSVAGQAPG